MSGAVSPSTDHQERDEGNERSEKSNVQGKKTNVQSKKKVFLNVAEVGVLIIVIAVPIYFLIDFSVVEDFINPVRAVTICETQECQMAAEFFKSSMNFSANPCEDYFNYVCGKWVQDNKGNVPKRNKILWDRFLDDESKLDSQLKDLLNLENSSDCFAVKQAKEAFKICVDSDPAKEREGIRRVIKGFGGFPIYDLSTYNRSMPWYERSAKVIRQFGMYDDESDGFYQGAILNIILAGDIFGFVKPFIYEEPSYYASEQYTSSLKNFICNVLKESCSKKESRRVAKQVKELAKFEATMAEYVKLDGEDDGTDTIQNLAELYPEMHLFEFMREVLKNSDPRLKKSTTFGVSNVDGYLSKIGPLFKVTKPEIIDNFIGMQNFLLFLSEKTPKETAKTYRFFSTDKNEMKRDFCYKKIKKVFPFVLGRLYVDNFLPIDNLPKVFQIIQDMRNMFIELISEKSWIQNIAKKEAIDKIRLMSFEVGYPKWLKTDIFFNQYYSMKEKMVNSSAIEMFKSIFSFATDELFRSRICPGYKSTSWGDIRPNSFNAEYSRMRNNFIFPATQCIPPLFWTDATKALLYSGAFFIGHEMTHSIDTGGSRYDKFSNQRNWWDNASRQAFEERQDCIVKQHSSVVIPEINMTLNGSTTIEEDIADSGGIRIMYHAYMKSGPKDERLPGLENISDQQLLFIGAASVWCAVYSPEGMKDAIEDDDHTLDIFRLSIPPSNMEEFSRAFDCPKTSKMNRQNKCVLW